MSWHCPFFKHLHMSKTNLGGYLHSPPVGTSVAFCCAVIEWPGVCYYSQIVLADSWHAHFTFINWLKLGPFKPSRPKYLPMAPRGTSQYGVYPLEQLGSELHAPFSLWKHGVQWLCVTLPFHCYFCLLTCCFLEPNLPPWHVFALFIGVSDASAPVGWVLSLSPFFMFT